jgi:hypothetical protein
MTRFSATAILSCLALVVFPADGQQVIHVQRATVHVRVSCYTGHIRLDGIVDTWGQIFWSNVDLPAAGGFPCTNPNVAKSFEDTYIAPVLTPGKINQLAFVVRPQPESGNSFTINLQVLDGESVVYRASRAPSDGPGQPAPFIFFVD